MREEGIRKRTCDGNGLNGGLTRLDRGRGSSDIVKWGAIGDLARVDLRGVDWIAGGGDRGGQVDELRMISWTSRLSHFERCWVDLKCINRRSSQALTSSSK